MCSAYSWPPLQFGVIHYQKGLINWLLNILNFISFYLARRLQWWHHYCKTIFFLIKAKTLDNFTFNTFTFSYPLFHVRVNHFPNIWTIHAKIGVRKYKISASPSNKSLNGAGALSCRPVTCTVYKIIKTANWSLKQKTYILKYICLYILRFILLFTSSLPFYNFLQVIRVVIGVGWVRNLRPKRGKGTSARGIDFWYFPGFRGLRR